MAIGAYIGAPLTVPSNYTQLESVSSDTNYAVYIQNFIKVTPNTRILIRASLGTTTAVASAGANTAQSILFGAGYPNNYFSPTRAFVFVITPKNGTYVYRAMCGTEMHDFSVPYVHNGVFTLDANKNVWTLTGPTGASETHTFSSMGSIGSTVYPDRLDLLRLYYDSGATGSSSKSIVRVQNCQVYENDKMVKHLVPCQSKTEYNNYGVLASGLYDIINRKFIKGKSDSSVGRFLAITGTLYRPLADCRVSKIYVGVSGIARKVKKAYIGVNGIARPFWDDRTISRRTESWTTVVNIDSRARLAATTVGDYAMFGGGESSYYSNSAHTDQVVCFSPTLTRTNRSLSSKRSQLEAVTIGGYALFGGGYITNYYESDTVDAFNTSGTRSSAPALSVARHGMKATTVGDYAIFAGARREDSYDNEQKAVDAYNSSLVKNANIQALPEGLLGLSAANAGNGSVAIFTGGLYYSGSVQTYSYDTSLTANFNTNPLSSFDCYYKGAVSFGKYAIFGGGEYEDTTTESFYDEETEEWYDEEVEYTDVSGLVSAIDESLTRKDLENFSWERSETVGVTLGKFAIFGGGVSYHWSSYDGYYEAVSVGYVDFYDSNLVKFYPSGRTDFMYVRHQHAAASIGDYALFYGGWYESGTDDDGYCESGYAGDGYTEVYMLS